MEIRKSHIALELPGDEALAALGIDLELAEARLVLATVSRMLVARSTRERNELYRAMHFVLRAVEAELLDEDGTVRPPLLDLSGIASPPAPHTACALRRLGVDAKDLNAIWEAQPTFPGSCLPISLICALLPPRSWPLIAAIGRCGPYEASLRLHVATTERGRSLSPKALESHLDATWLLLRALVAIRTEIVARNGARERDGDDVLEFPAALDAWERVPEKPSGKKLRALAHGSKHDTSAVPPHLIRERLHALAREAEWGRWPPAEWPFNRNWLKLKRLALLALLATVAPRRGHLAQIQVRDVVLDHVFRDGTRGPALLMRGERGMKGRARGYSYAVRLPEPLADILHAWIVCNGKRPGATDDPLFPAQKASRPGAPQRRIRDISAFIAAGPGSGTRPLVPLQDDPSRGYSAHRFRSTLTQGVDRLMAAWQHEHPQHELAGPDHSVFAECILDHIHKDLGYRDLRDNDGDPTARYEQLVAAGVAAWFAELWGDGPNVRRGLDLDAIEKTHTRLRLVDARIDDLTAEIERLRRDDTASEPDGLSAAQAIAALLRMQTNSRRRECLLEEREELRLERSRIEQELARHLEHEVLLPADTCDGTYERRRARLLATIEGNQAPQDDQPQPLLLADELTVADIAELFGVTTQHVGRWRRGLSNPPLDPQAWRCVNGKDYRFPVSAVDAAALRRIPARDPRAALDQIRHKRARDGFGRRAAPQAIHA